MIVIFINSFLQVRFFVLDEAVGILYSKYTDFVVKMFVLLRRSSGLTCVSFQIYPVGQLELVSFI